MTAVSLKQPDAPALASHTARQRAFMQRVADMANPPLHREEMVSSVGDSGPYDVWRHELDRVWPAIPAVAA